MKKILRLLRLAADTVFRPPTTTALSLRRALVVGAGALLVPPSLHTFREKVPAASGRVQQLTVPKPPPINPTDQLLSVAAFLPKDQDGKLDPANRADLEKFLVSKEGKAIAYFLPSVIKAFDHNLGGDVSHAYGQEAQRLAYVLLHTRQAMVSTVTEAAPADKRTVVALQQSMMRFFQKVQQAHDYHETDQRRTAQHHTTADVVKECLVKPIKSDSDVVAVARAVTERHLADHVQFVEKLVDVYPAFTRATAKVILDTCANSDVSVPVCLSTAAAESHLNPVNQNKQTGATGLAQYQEPDWYRAINWLDKVESGRAVLAKYPALQDLKESLQLVGRDQYGQGNFDVVDRSVAKNAANKTKADRAKLEWARNLRLNPEINLAVWACQAETNMAVMAEILKRKPSSDEMWLANIVGPSRAARFARFASTNPTKHSGESGILSEAEVRLNPLFNASAGAVMARAKDEVAMAVRAAPVLAVHLVRVPETARPDPRQVVRPTRTQKLAQAAPFQS